MSVLCPEIRGPWQIYSAQTYVERQYFTCSATFTVMRVVISTYSLLVHCCNGISTVATTVLQKALPLRSLSVQWKAGSMREQQCSVPELYMSIVGAAAASVLQPWCQNRIVLKSTSKITNLIPTRALLHLYNLRRPWRSWRWGGQGPLRPQSRKRAIKRNLTGTTRYLVKTSTEFCTSTARFTYEN